ncbi:alpha/beta fold hydrolase [Aeromicrobium sp. CF4.19]|uniref:alpha/beta fold hydrolase n=1 Tax=Aeromicrobium sp. CF4.19 TaxID=3373082 RepID=UPI003EE7CBD4
MGLARHDHGGDGPPLVLLHAFPLDGTTWRRLVSPARRAWRPISVDLPGLGGSPVPADAPSMSVVADLVLDVLDDLGLDRVTVFGVSTGGYVALQLAESAPERLAALVLGSTTTRTGAPDDPDGRRRDADELEASGSTDVVAASAQEGLGATARREQPELERELTSLIAGADPRGVAWLARAIASRHDTTDVLAAFDGPVQLVFGDEDLATLPSVAAALRACRPDHLPTRLDVLGGTGHLAALEQPERVLATLAWLLRR